MTMLLMKSIVLVKKCNFVFHSRLNFIDHLSGHENKQVKNKMIECLKNKDEYHDDIELYVDTCNYC